MTEQERVTDKQDKGYREIGESHKKLFDSREMSEGKNYIKHKVANIANTSNFMCDIFDGTPIGNVVRLRSLACKEWLSLTKDCDYKRDCEGYIDMCNLQITEFILCGKIFNHNQQD